MRQSAKFTFEGEEMTVAEIQKRVPILAGRTIRDHLRAGRTTLMAMLSFDSKAPARRAARQHNATRKIARRQASPQGEPTGAA